MNDVASVVSQNWALDGRRQGWLSLTALFVAVALICGSAFRISLSGDPALQYLVLAVLAAIGAVFTFVMWLNANKTYREFKRLHPEI